MRGIALNVMEKIEMEEVDPILQPLPCSREAAVNRIQGKVDFSFQITSAGCIDSIQILNSPHELLSTEVIRVLEKTKCRWTPGSVNQIPVRTALSSSITFYLD